MTSFADLKKTYRLQKEAKKARKELKGIHVEAEGPGVRVTVSGEMEVMEIAIDPTQTSIERVGDTLKDCLNRAYKKAQVVSAEKMQGVMQEMGIGGQ